MNLFLSHVTSSRDRKSFAHLPFELFADLPQWTPPLRKAEARTLDPAHNPGLRHTDFAAWIAWHKGKAVGRMAAFINALETQKKGKTVARFGWLDFVDDPEVSHMLLNQAETWAKARGAESLLGPVGLTNMDPAGLLVEGFSQPNYLSTLYGHPYYVRHLEQAGYAPAQTWIETDIRVPREVPQRLEKIRQLLSRRYQLKLHTLPERGDVRSEGRRLFELMRQSYAQLDVYVPITDAQVDYYIDQFVPLIRRDLVSAVTGPDDEIVGFGIMIPDIAPGLRKARGRLWPLGWRHILKARKQPEVAQLMLIGVSPEWRNRGVPAFIFSYGIQSLIQAGIARVHINPMLEDNQAIHALFAPYGPEITHRRQTFQKVL
ncbi:MAG: hypothetical protein D6722_02180 [Bacteroidetes bacterium]|nr:MAG: hypothetical protein D6722_02180 [Bacteroidota bacterium]